MMNLFLILLASIILSAFFSGMEIAFLSSNKMRLELDRKKGMLSAHILSFFIRKPGDYIATMLVGNITSLVLYGLLMSTLLGPILRQHTSSETLILSLQAILSTLLIILTGEYLPKLIFRIHPNGFLHFLSLPVVLFYILLYPVSKLTLAIAHFFIRFFFRSRASQMNRMKIFERVDLDHLVKDIDPDDEENLDNQDEIRIFQNVLDFSKVRLRDCMIPRTEIVAIDEKSNIAELQMRFVESGYSKIIVYKDSIDHVIGYISSKDLFKSPGSIHEILVKPMFVPETMPANKLLHQLLHEHKSLAVVIDEFGGTSGLITIEDILEEIFGEIEDEHDTPELVQKKISEHEYILSGRLEIEHLNEEYDLGLPESDDYETLAGYVLFQHQNLPKPNEIIKTGRFVFKILKMNNTRLELIHLLIVTP